MMPYQIVQVNKPLIGVIVERELKEFESLRKAVRVLYKLAYIKHWDHIPGVLLDKFQDHNNNFYYVKEKK